MVVVINTVTGAISCNGTQYLIKNQDVLFAGLEGLANGMCQMAHQYDPHWDRDWFRLRSNGDRFDTSFESDLAAAAEMQSQLFDCYIEETKGEE